MSDEIEAFFEGLGPRAPRILPEKFTGTIRFDLLDDGAVERWCVVLEKGTATVSRGECGADSVVRVDRRLFARIVTGEIGIVAAAFSGRVLVEGSFALMVTFKRFLGTPAGAQDPRELAARRGRP